MSTFSTRLRRLVSTIDAHTRVEETEETAAMMRQHLQTYPAS